MTKPGSFALFGTYCLGLSWGRFWVISTAVLLRVVREVWGRVNSWTSRIGQMNDSHALRHVMSWICCWAVTGYHSKQDLRYTQKPTRYIFGPIYLVWCPAIGHKRNLRWRKSTRKEKGLMKYSRDKKAGGARTTEGRRACCWCVTRGLRYDYCC